MSGLSWACVTGGFYGAALLLVLVTAGPGAQVEPFPPPSPPPAVTLVR